MAEPPPFKLKLDDMEVRITRSYRLSEPTRVDTKPRLQAVLATMVQVTERTYSTGVSETEIQVRGRELKANGTVDERKPANWFTLFRGNEMLPDPREPFIEALHTLADEREM